MLPAQLAGEAAEIPVRLGTDRTRARHCRDFREPCSSSGVPKPAARLPWPDRNSRRRGRCWFRFLRRVASLRNYGGPAVASEPARTRTSRVHYPILSYPILSYALFPFRIFASCRYSRSEERAPSRLLVPRSAPCLHQTRNLPERLLFRA